MSSKHSHAGNDGIVWHTVGLRLGTRGLDLRQPSDPDALSELLNARFADESHLARRDGHVGRRAQDASNFPAGGASLGPGEWVYGHGWLVDNVLGTGFEKDHHPIANHALATFNLDGDVVWTGDRLLAMRDDGPALGEHKIWDQMGTTARACGIPAYLPTMTDEVVAEFPLLTTIPAAFPNDAPEGYVTGCLTADLRIVAFRDTTLQVRVHNRDNGALIAASTVTVDGTARRIVALESGGVPVILVSDSLNKLYLTRWTGLAWSTPVILRTDVGDWDVVPVSGGMHLLWRQITGGTLHVGYVSGVTTQSVPYAFGKTLTIDHPLGGAIALAVDENGMLGVAFNSPDGVIFRQYTNRAELDPFDSASCVVHVDQATAVSVAPRAVGAQPRWVVHASGVVSDVWKTVVQTVYYDSTVYTPEAGCIRYNTQLASRSFRVGAEVFAWLTTRYATTHFLAAGAAALQVAGYADDEESWRGEYQLNNAAVITHVMPDFGDTTGYRRTWVRRVATIQQGARFGELNFLPRLSIARFGRSVYLSGSAVKNWDGSQLADAGFHDYPTVKSTTLTGGGGLAASGKYRWRVYAVRYNAKAERFMSSAISTAEIVLTASNTRATLVIPTIPSVSTEDVFFEVYRTEWDAVTSTVGTTYYLEGVVKNDLAAASVSFVSTMNDTTLRTKPGDPHNPAVGQLAETEEWGAPGCTMLATIGDRLWAAGGQIPPGVVRFSKLIEPNEGAGFDAISGYHVVDATGEPVTSVAGVNNAVAVFQVGRVHIFDGPGPDNYGRGGYEAPQLVLADGATTHFGTTVIPAGVLYWSAQGPLLLGQNIRVEDVSAPVRELALGLDPSGVRTYHERSEVVWFTERGDCLLLNYANGVRWARWSGLPAAGVSETAHVTPDGVLMTESATAAGDAGRPFHYTGSSGWVRPEQLLQSATRIRNIGIVGEHVDEHRLRLRLYYDDSPLWEEQLEWQPTTKTYLAATDSFAALTPAQVDALEMRDRHGGYGTRKRPARGSCNRIRVEFSDGGSATPTFVPWELTFELGVNPGAGRVPVGTFTSTVAR